MLSTRAVESASRHFDLPLSSYIKPAVPRLSKDNVYRDVVREFLNATTQLVFVTVYATDRRLWGIISREDVTALELANSQRPMDTPLALLVNQKIIVLRTTNNVGDAVRVFAGDNPMGRPISRVPVLDEDGILVGYVDSADVIGQITS